ncbi:MAG: NADPH:quinone oxidoreductase family protein [Beijerinckiaceae bacterium]|nr:NADPH:quinone oxidoreductase family protein [Beijerinckiaceae bacterium]
MRAVVFDQFGPFENARVAEIARPQARASEIVIEVHAAPVNYVDLVVVAGKYQFAPPLPFTPGKGPAGVVVEIGEGAQGFKLGDRVLAMAETGGYAEYARAPASDCYAIPDTMSFSQAGAMSLAYDTAWFALTDRGRLKAGETLLVLGSTGAVGRACMQLGKAMGARVIAAISSPARAEAAMAAGADGVVNLAAEDLRENLRKEVAALTNGAGADVVIDMLGGDIFDAAVRAVAWRGRVVIVGFAAGRIPTIKVNYLMLKNMEVSGLQISDYRKRRPDMLQDCYRQVFGFFERGLIDPGGVVELPLARFAEAMRMVEQRATLDRVILTPQKDRA